MGALESAYELMNCSEVYIDSEEYNGYIFWQFAMRDICDALKQNPTITSLEFAELIIPSICQNSFSWPD